MAEAGTDATSLPAAGNAFLLAQVGAHATARYAARVAALDRTPAQTGVLRLVAQTPGQSQQALAAKLGVVPSKIVELVDGLEAAGLLERQRNSADRRHYALHLTEGGRDALREIRAVALAHDTDITAALSDSERDQLKGLLQRIADQQGLTPGVHPGYRNLAARKRSAAGADPLDALQ